MTDHTVIIALDPYGANALLSKDHIRAIALNKSIIFSNLKNP